MSIASANDVADTPDWSSMQPDTGPTLDPAALVRQLTEQSAQMRERAEAARAELAEIVEEVTSKDRAVTVSVGSGGVMRGVRFDASATRVPPTQLAASVMSAYADGCRRAARRAADVMQRHAPNSPAVEMMRQSIPPDPDEDDGGARR